MAKVTVSNLANLYTLKNACNEIVERMSNVVAPYIYNGHLLPDANEYVIECNDTLQEFAKYRDSFEKELIEGIREYIKP